MVKRVNARKAYWAGGLSETELDAADQYFSKIKSFRKECPELSEHWCLKFLHNKQYDVTRAVAGFKTHVEWRLSQNVRASMNRRMHKEALIWSYWPQYFIGRDKDCRPVLYTRIGELDVDALIEKHGLTIDDLVMFHVKQQEYMRELTEEASRQEGRVVDRCAFVIDLTGTSLRRHLSTHARELFSKITSVDSKNYPETLATIIIVNSSRMFPIMWSFVKTMVDPKARARIEVHSSAKITDTTGWPAKIRTLMKIKEGKKLPAVMDPSHVSRLPPDGRLPSENPHWHVLGYKGPAKPGKLKPRKTGSSSRKSKAASSVTEDDERALLLAEGDGEDDDEESEQYSGTLIVPPSDASQTKRTVNTDDDTVSELYSEAHQSDTVPNHSSPIKPEELERMDVAIASLRACIEAEGLSGAVELKANPSWQCIHCKQEFPLVQLSELQEHENTCAQTAALNVRAMRGNPTQNWLEDTMGRGYGSGSSTYRNIYQEGKIVTNRKDDDDGETVQPLTLSTAAQRMKSCCIQQ
uniref:CRAL-TRIO domain-containing protein n=1 Tax=Pyramimonas obovata TaxID=1411642 RepID=A0A7S0MZI8_9CHLO|mmetsp:Transcript_17180/g.37353  ORF Transcript_17180/g.37353 Transcript_17180/m.37353 type:complete len:524 (+) Transcript_17180:323-1894(+)|eukprot:CAMPEP_0118931828 /NCGR_PEP_ID=MMETSP1169-20130426/8034_1 /TAXON_ID=36882 /ORGANISM="Pyramimonas obovata, Strain CCMP722" /LENGTH=523 /DNA_ID=CAMNT_0006874379 /DNA_START=300 /DNA_END=1871 /DNA_ORIENTATION=-